MAENTLVHRYRLYKCGTAKMVAWLANGAQEIKEVTNIIPALSVVEANAKQPKKIGKSKPSVQTNIKISTAQLLSLAEVVAHSSTSIPADIFDTLDRVIAGRQHCAEWYAAVSSSSVTAAATQNEGHRHFISILKDIQRLFEKFRPSHTAEPKAKKSTLSSPNEDSIDNARINNMFAYLSLDEPTNEPLGSAPARNRTNKPVTCELEDSKDEKELAIWCLLEDFRDVRLELQALWVEYKNNNVSLVTASMVTYVAISLLRFAETEFINERPDLGSFDLIMNHLGLQAGSLGSEIFLCPSSQYNCAADKKDVTHSQELVNLLCTRAYLIMLAYRDAVISKTDEPEPVSQQESFHFFKIHPFGQILQSLVPDFKLIKQRTLWTEPFVEHLTQGLHTLADEQQPRLPTWLVAACQISMDINDIIKCDGERGIEEYLTKMQAFQASMRKLIKDLNIKPGPAIVGDSYKVLKHLGNMAKNPYHDARPQSSRPADSAHDTSALYFRVHKAIPARIGMLQYIAATAVHFQGTMHSSTAGLAISAAYLYKAALVAGAITKPWRDMEFVIDTQSKKRPFVLIPKDGIASMAKYFGTALGVKLSAYRRGQRPRLPKTETILSKMRTVETDWPLCSETSDYFYRENTRAPVDRDLPVVNAAIKGIRYLEKSPSKSGRAEDLIQQYRKSGKMTPSQLVFAFKEAFISDEMDLHFNYIGFLFACAELIGKINLTGGPALRALVGKGKNEELMPYETTYAVLWDAVDRSQDQSR